MPRHHFDVPPEPSWQSLPIEPESSNAMNMSTGALQLAGFASPPLAPPEDVVPELPKPLPLDDPFEAPPLAPPLDPKSLSLASEPQAITRQMPPTTPSTALARTRRLMFPD